MASLEATGCDASNTSEGDAKGGAPPSSTGGTPGNAGNPAANGGAPAPSSGGSATGGAVLAGAANGGGGGSTSAGNAGGGAGGAANGGSSNGGTPSGGMASSGSAGLGGNAGSGGMSTAGSGGKIGTGSHQFPENQRLERCAYPTNANPADVVKAYERFKTEIVTSEGARGHLRVKRPNSPGAEVDSTVSEGIAYGMVIAVAMGDQPLFDGLWKYSQEFLNENGLMHWYINPAGTAPISTGGATDSDEDMAWALVMADRQWGGKGSLDKDYIEYAKTQIQAIWDHEIDHTQGDFLKPGDTWNETVFNPSYFAPNQYRIFGQVTGKVAEWNRVIDRGYEMLDKCLNAENKNQDNGLAPAWCDLNGKPTGTNSASNYQYDSARIPFRIGQDYCYNGEPRAKAYLEKISTFFANIGAAKIVDGYALDGTPEPDKDSAPNGPQSAVFVGTAAVGAMHDPKFQSFIDEAYALVATGELLARSRYYNLSWTPLTLLMLTGNLNEFPAR
ncbi:MAG: glycosyl hydrolase family 8 [Myxococcota bacterium]|nr:glycosyl hydrolase family 8 [Myxococcota bacterium]